MVEAAKRVVFDRVKVSKLEEVSYEMLVLTFPYMSPLVSLWLSSDVAVTMVEAAKCVVFDRVKVSKLEEVSYEMLVLTLPPSPMSPLVSLWLSSDVAVTMVEAAKRVVLLIVSKCQNSSEVSVRLCSFSRFHMSSSL